MQQRLVLGRRPCRSRLRGHRFHALALARQDQAGAIIAQRTNPIRMPNNARKSLYLRRKSCVGVAFAPQIHVSTSRANREPAK
jgi:hypothetical protein